nr:MAG TPA: hypothetical protein [Caudoviricetes sp.]
MLMLKGKGNQKSLPFFKLAFMGVAIFNKTT